MKKDCRYCRYHDKGYCKRIYSCHYEFKKRSNWFFQLLFGSELVRVPGAKLPPCRCCAAFDMGPTGYLLYQQDRTILFGTPRTKGQGLYDAIKKRRRTPPCKLTNKDKKHIEEQARKLTLRMSHEATEYARTCEKYYYQQILQQVQLKLQVIDTYDTNLPNVYNNQDKY